MERLFSLLNRIPADKALHALGGAVISALSLCFWLSPLALIVTIVLAFGKELYDLAHNDQHIPDTLDALATIAGGLLPFLPFYAHTLKGLF